MDLMERVKDYETRTVSWTATRANATDADKVVAAEMAAVTAQHQRNGLLLASPDTLRQYEGNFRKHHDQVLLAEGGQIEADREALAAEIDAAMRAAEELHSLQEYHEANTDRHLLAGILQNLEVQNVRASLVGKTRKELTDVYTVSTDDTHRTLVRLIEHAVAGGALSQLGLRDDPEHDALSILALQTAIRQRRQARVPQSLRDARSRLEKVSTLGFASTMRFLRDGLGIAARPRSVA
jgi:hypothetical protein